MKQHKCYNLFLFILFAVCQINAQTDKLIIEPEDKVNPYPESGKACIEFRSTQEHLVIRDTYGNKATNKGKDPKTKLSIVYELVYEVEDVDPKMTIYISAPDYPIEVKLEQPGITSKARYFYTISAPKKGKNSLSEFKLNGTIKDNTDKIIPGASILQVGTKNATTSDNNGEFTLTTTGKGTLKISSDSYHTIMIPLDHQTKRMFTLKKK